MTARSRRGAALAWRGPRCAAIAAALTASALVTPAVSAAPLPALTGDVTLTAATTAYLRVRLTRTLDLTKFNAYTSPPVFSGSGPVGFALLPDRLGSRARNVVIARVRTDAGYQLVESQAYGIDPVTGEDAAPRLRAGVYRMFLLTRGGGSVRLRLPGLPGGGQRLTARSPVPLVLGETTAPVDAQGTGPVSWEPTLDFAGRQPGHVFGALWWRSTATAYMRAGSCYFTEADAATRDRPLCLGGRHGGGLERPGVRVGRLDWLWHGSIYTRAPGNQALRLYYANGGRVEAAGALMFFLPAA